MSTLDYYNQNAASFIQDTVSVPFYSCPDCFLEYLPSNAYILDFGCGSGRDTRYFLEHGIEVDAVDGSKELCKIASEYTGISIKQMLFHELNAVGEYDGIWACASILHVSKNELKDLFLQMRTALKQNGILYTSFKYGTFNGMRGARYYTDFTEETFQEFLENVPGFKIEKCWQSNDARPGRSDEKWLNLILRKQNTH